MKDQYSSVKKGGTIIRTAFCLFLNIQDNGLKNDNSVAVMVHIGVVELAACVNISRNIVR